MARLLFMLIAGFVVWVTLGWPGVLGGLVGLLLAGALAGGGPRAGRPR